MDNHVLTQGEALRHEHMRPYIRHNTAVRIVCLTHKVFIGVMQNAFRPGEADKNVWYLALDPYAEIITPIPKDNGGPGFFIPNKCIIRGEPIHGGQPFKLVDAHVIKPANGESAITIVYKNGVITVSSEVKDYHSTLALFSKPN